MRVIDCDAVVLCDGVNEGVSVDVGVCEKLWDGDCEFVSDCDADDDTLLLWLCDCDWLGVALPEGVSVLVSLWLGVPVALPEPDWLGVLEAVDVGLGVPVALAVNEGVRDCDCVAVCVGVGEQPRLRATTSMPAYPASSSYSRPSCDTTGETGSPKPRTGTPPWVSSESSAQSSGSAERHESMKKRDSTVFAMNVSGGRTRLTWRGSEETNGKIVTFMTRSDAATLDVDVFETMNRYTVMGTVLGEDDASGRYMFSIE